MVKNKVRIEKGDDEWVASLEGNPEIKGEGSTKAKAIGHMYMRYADRIEIVVDGKKSEAPCCHCGKE